MKKWKRFVVCFIALILMASLAACTEPATDEETSAANTESGTETSESADTSETTQVQEEGDKLVIYTWNDEFQTRYTEYFEKPGLLPEGIEVEFVITPDQDNVYQNKLDEDLQKNMDASADEKIDIFIVEADYATKYVNSEYTLDIVNDIGLTEEDLANQYEYTQTIVSDQEGNLKATSWHATPETLYTGVPSQKRCWALMIRMKFRRFYLTGINLMRLQHRCLKMVIRCCPDMLILIEPSQIMFRHLGSTKTTKSLLIRTL